MIKSELPKESESYWRESSDLPRFEKLNEVRIQVDVGIVGAGMTGITAAYNLAKKGYSVALLEAKKVLDGTTGHTTAKITTQHGLIYDELIQHFGLEQAKLYLQANESAHQFIKDTINNLEIECDYREEDSFLYTNETNMIEQLLNEHKAYEQLKMDGDLITKTALPFDVLSALQLKKQAIFHPLKFQKALLKECIHLGVHIFEDTRAASVEYNKNPTIMTIDQKRVVCKHVIQASHYPFHDGVGMYPLKMYADRAYVLAAKVNNPITRGMYINIETPTRSLRPVIIDDEPYILLAGENHKTGQSKQDMLEHYQALQGFLEEKFDLETVSYRWSAQDYTTLDKLPYIGPVTATKQNVYVATGYRKWGMTNGVAAALLLTDLIEQKENEYAELFSPSRGLKSDKSLKNMVHYNTDVAKHLVKGKLSRPDDEIDQLEVNEACVTKIKGDRVGVYKDYNENLHAVDTTCTHMGCELAWNNAEYSWDCPCHGSRFNYQGEVLNGPAIKPLKKIEL